MVRIATIISNIVKCQYYYCVAESGVIRTAMLLDFETDMSYSLVVRATDNGIPQRTGKRQTHAIN